MQTTTAVQPFNPLTDAATLALGHRRDALEHLDEALDLAHTIKNTRPGSEAYRAFGQQLGVALKAAGVHADLALACAKLAGPVAS